MAVEEEKRLWVKKSRERERRNKAVNLMKFGVVITSVGTVVAVEVMVDFVGKTRKGRENEGLMVGLVKGKQRRWYGLAGI